MTRVKNLLDVGSTTNFNLCSMFGTLESTKVVNTRAALHYRGLQRHVPRLKQAVPRLLQKVSQDGHQVVAA